MSHIGGVSSGTDEGAMTIRIPSPTIASAERHIDGGFRGQELLGEDEDGDHGHPGDAHDARRHQHQHQHQRN
jgi:hypothetical protein